MLRTLLFALALGAPSFAAADEFRDSAVGIEVRGDDGSVIGRVGAVERDADGRIVAAELPGLEPDDGPAAPRDLIAEEDPRWVSALDRPSGERPAGGGRSASR